VSVLTITVTNPILRLDAYKKGYPENLDQAETPIPTQSTTKSTKSTGRTIAMATGLMIFTITISRILGFVREMLLMAYFGQGALTDVYKQSFLIPDSLYFLIAGGALSSAFIPVFTKYMTEGNKKEAWKTFSIVVCTVFLATTVFVIICEIFAVPLSRLVSPGFSLLPEQIRQMAYLTRIVLPAQGFFFLGGLMMGSLYSHNKFLAPAFGPLIYTICIIAGGLISAHFHPAQLKYLHSPEVVNAMHVWKDPHASAHAKDLVKPIVEHALRVGTPAVSGYSWGALIGALIGNFFVQLVAIRRIGMVFKPSLHFAHPGAKRVFALMLPVILGLSLPQVDQIIIKFFGSMLISGSITALDNANRLMQVPYGVLGTSFGIALFPTLSALAAQRLWGDYRLQISKGIRRVLFMALPASVLLMVLAIPAVRLVILHGKLITTQDISVTALTLIMFSIGIFGWCMQAIIARGFYALQDTKTVVITGTIMTVIFVLLNIGFIKSLPDPRAVWWAPAALALITSFAAVSQAFVLLWLLKGRIGGINGRQIASSTGKMFLACGAMAMVTVPIYHIIERLPKFASIMNNPHASEFHRVAATGGELVIVSTVGLIVYALISRLLKLEELDNARTMILGRFGRRKSAETA
jgi:putative peptidoglycan lipid II flippase